MTPEKRKIWLQKEEARLINYQHQHRGINFIKLLLPPTTDKEVNLVGIDNHIYKGRIPKVPEDQLPPNVDEESIDEETLYKEIRDMSFPPVPPKEPLGPSRRIEGKYTLAKKLSLAPLRINHAGLEDALILGRDGHIYKGTEKHASIVELDKQLRGTKRSIQKVRQQRSSRGYIEPSIVMLQTGGKTAPFGRKHTTLIDVPVTNAQKVIEMTKIKEKGKLKPEESTEVKELENEQDKRETVGENEVQEEKDTKELQKTKDEEESTTKEESPESKGEEESVESLSEEEPVEAKDEEESVESVSEDEPPEEKDEEESVESVSEDEPPEAKDEEESVESVSEDEPPEAKDEEESVESISEAEPLEAKDDDESLIAEEESSESKDEEESLELTGEQESPQT